MCEPMKVKSSMQTELSLLLLSQGDIYAAKHRMADLGFSGWLIKF